MDKSKFTFTDAAVYAVTKTYTDPLTVKLPHIHTWRLAMIRHEICAVCEGCADKLTGREVETVLNVSK